MPGERIELHQLQAAMALAFTQAVMTNMKSNADQRIALGIEAATDEFERWAPLVNTWTGPEIEQAVKHGVASGITQSTVSFLLDSATAEAAAATSPVPRRPLKRAPSQAPAHRAAKARHQACSASGAAMTL